MLLAAASALAACTSSDAARGVGANGAGTPREAGSWQPLDGGSEQALDTGSTGATRDAHTMGAAEPPQKCVVFLHGKSGSGFASRRESAYLLLGPTGNADGWGGKQWLYFPEARYTEMRLIIEAALQRDGCKQAILHGFSNGAAAVAKLYCRGEDFGGKVLGYIIDDPVPDHGADQCAPPAGAKARLYWTGALTPAEDWDCKEADWTCEGGTTVGVQKYAANLRLSATPSVKTGHEAYGEPPEYRSWW